MARLTAAQVYAALLAGGFTADQAQKLTAIGGAESKLNPTALGDLTLQDAKWGPSVGVFQIRTLKAETGTGSTRDIQWLQGSLVNQVKAAYSISSGGRDFTPWSTFTSGSYRDYLPGSSAVPAGWWDKVKELPGDIAGGLGGAVGDAAGGALGSLAAPLVDGFRSIAYQVAFASLGLALVGAGVAFTFRAQIKSAAGTAAKVVL